MPTANCQNIKNFFARVLTKVFRIVIMLYRRAKPSRNVPAVANGNSDGQRKAVHVQKFTSLQPSKGCGLFLFFATNQKKGQKPAKLARRFIMTKEKQIEAKKMAKAMAKASLMVAINATKLSGDAMGIGNRVYLNDKAKAFQAFQDAIDPFLCFLTDKEIDCIFEKYEQEVASYESSMA